MAFIRCEAPEGLFERVAEVRDRVGGLGTQTGLELGKDEFGRIEVASRSFGSGE